MKNSPRRFVVSLTVFELTDSPSPRDFVSENSTKNGQKIIGVATKLLSQIFILNNLVCAIRIHYELNFDNYTHGCPEDFT